MRLKALLLKKAAIWETLWSQSHRAKGSPQGDSMLAGSPKEAFLQV
jgi:hypothetical protein